MAKGRPSVSSRTWLAMMFVDVPTSVTRPPRSDRKAIGIRMDEDDVPVVRDTRRATGMRIASAPTFLVSIDSKAVAPEKAATCVGTVRRRDNKGRRRSSATPDLATAALITSAEAMITTTSLVNPEKACLAGTTPTMIPARSALKATRS
jgi:hypothetical protein